MNGTIGRICSDIYRRTWNVLVRWLRVPDRPPTLPVREGDSLEQFRPAEGFLQYLKLWFWLGLLVVDLLILVGWIVIVVLEPLIGLALAPVAFVLAVAPDIVVYVALHVRYDTMWYVMTSRSIRIRRGVWIIREMTITFENIQNVKIRQGPVQRHFGIADLLIDTAGGGSGGEGQTVAHQGIIEGIADAQRIRDIVLSRLRASRTSGLGDEERKATRPEASWTSDHLSVLAEIRDEIVALKTVGS